MLSVSKLGEVPTDVKEASKESSRPLTRVSSLKTETSAELSHRSNAYRGPAEGGNSTKATTLDKSTGSEAAAARAKITKAWESTELYK